MRALDGRTSRRRGLSLQVAILMTLALFPLGMVSFYIANELVRETDRIAAISLMARLEAAVSGERQMLQSARGAGSALAVALTTGVDDPDGCDAILDAYVQARESVARAAVLDLEGRTICASDGSREDLGGSPVLMLGDGSDGTIFVPRSVGLPSVEVNQAAVTAMTPMFRDGARVGQLLISVPHRVARVVASTEDVVDVVTVNERGEVLAATGDPDALAMALPRGYDPAAPTGADGRIFVADGEDGIRRRYAAMEIVGDGVRAIGFQTLHEGLATIGPERWLLLLLPVLMWIVGMATAYYGMQNLVLRHIKRLRSAMRKFALGHRDGVSVDLSDAPAEIDSVGLAYNRMAMILTESQARNAQDIREKTILLREVHHRVKNNLQLISSIVNMQRREAVSEEARTMMDRVQRRVLGLAAIHRSLYTKPDEPTVDAALLVRQLIEEAVQAAGARLRGDVDLDLDLETLDLLPDQAVPLSMLLSEVVTNAFAHIGAVPGSRATMCARLRHLEDGAAELIIENTLVPGQGGKIGGTGLGERLIRAFTVQLAGALTAEIENDRHVTRLVFPVQTITHDSSQAVA